MIPPLDLLACPSCGGTLRLAQDLLRCASCAAEFSSRNGTFELAPQPVLRSQLNAGDDTQWSRWLEAAQTLSLWRARRRARTQAAPRRPARPDEGEIRRMLERVCVPGMTVLDVGAADGNKSALLPKGVRYVGLDPRPVMPPQTTPGGTLLQGVGEALPFRNGAFDVVLSIAALDCHNDAGTSVAEWARVLRPGGAVAVQLSVLTPRAARAANALTRLGRLLLAVAALPEVGPLGVGDLMYGSLVNRGRLKAHNYACGELEALLTPYFTVEDRREQDHPSGAVLYLTARKPDRAADQTGDRGARCSGGRPARMWGPSRLP